MHFVDCESFLAAYKSAQNIWPKPSKRRETVLWPIWIAILRRLDSLQMLSLNSIFAGARARECHQMSFPQSFGGFGSHSARLGLPYARAQTHFLSACDVTSPKELFGFEKCMVSSFLFH